MQLPGGRACRCVVLAGKEYGSGSSRDWAAKGPTLLGVRAVIAESYERIHRSQPGRHGHPAAAVRARADVGASLGLTGEEVVRRSAACRELIAAGFATAATATVRATRADGEHDEFPAIVRIDTPQEVLYYQHGGILQYVLRQLLGERDRPVPVAPVVAPTPAKSASDRAVDEGSKESFPASDPPAY